MKEIWGFFQGSQTTHPSKKAAPVNSEVRTTYRWRLKHPSPNVFLKAQTRHSAASTCDRVAEDVQMSSINIACGSGSVISAPVSRVWVLLLRGEKKKKKNFSCFELSDDEYQAISSPSWLCVCCLLIGCSELLSSFFYAGVFSHSFVIKRSATSSLFGCLSEFLWAQQPIATEHNQPLIDCSTRT